MPDRMPNLDRRITIQSATVAQDASGEEIETWSTYRDGVAAEYLPVSGQEQFDAHQRLATAVARFRIRYRTDLTREMRIVYDGELWDITHLEEDRRYDRRQFLVVTAKVRAIS